MIFQCNNMYLFNPSTTHDRDVLAANNIKKFGLRASTLNVKTGH